MLFAADRTGTVLLDAGPITVTTGVLTTALGLALRLLAVALPGVLVFATTDPTDLADALIQNARAPPRFAIGALAAFRLVPLLVAEWQTAEHGPAGPRRGRRPQPGGPAPALRRHRVRPAGRGDPAGHPAGHRDGRPRASTPARPGPSPAGSGSPPPTPRWSPAPPYWPGPR